MERIKFDYRSSENYSLVEDSELEVAKGELYEDGHLLKDRDVLKHALSLSLKNLHRFISEVVYSITDLEQFGISIDCLEEADDMFPAVGVNKKMDTAYKLFETLRPQFATITYYVDYLKNELILDHKNNFITKLKSMI